MFYFSCVFKKAETAAGERQTLATGGGRLGKHVQLHPLKARAPRRSSSPPDVTGRMETQVA